MVFIQYYESYNMLFWCCQMAQAEIDKMLSKGAHTYGTWTTPRMPLIGNHFTIFPGQKCPQVEPSPFRDCTVAKTPRGSQMIMLSRGLCPPFCRIPLRVGGRPKLTERVEVEGLPGAGALCELLLVVPRGCALCPLPPLPCSARTPKLFQPLEYLALPATAYRHVCAQGGTCQTGLAAQRTRKN